MLYLLFQSTTAPIKKLVQTLCFACSHGALVCPRGTLASSRPAVRGFPNLTCKAASDLVLFWVRSSTSNGDLVDFSLQRQMLSPTLWPEPILHGMSMFHSGSCASWGHVWEQNRRAKLDWCQGVDLTELKPVVQTCMNDGPVKAPS